MQTIKVKNLVLGSGTPKIIVPIMPTDAHVLNSQLAQYQQADFDMLEWRADYVSALDITNLESMSTILRKAFNLPILFTFRTKQEGGEQTITPADYVAINKAMIDSGNVDMIDLELSLGDEVADIVAYAHSKSVHVVASSHDFAKTPPKEEIINKFKAMQSVGADICKIAVMPNTAADVLTIMTATYEASQCIDKPLIAISMGKLGAVSRVAGELMGSCATFGTVGASSAPGQLAADTLREMLGRLSAQ
jgi:3-dehydroquinate dehydratase-1